MIRFIEETILSRIGRAWTKSLIALLLAAAMLSTSALATSAKDYYDSDIYYRGDELHEFEEYRYTIQADGTARIVACWPGAVTQVDIPESLEGHTVTALDRSAFYSNSSITRVTLPATLQEISGNPFIGCPNLTEIVVPPDHPVFQTIDGVLFSKPDRRLVSYPCAFTAKKYVIPQGTKIIGRNAFTSIYDGYRYDEADRGLTLGDMTFSWGWLSEVAIPEGVKTIEEAAFAFCGNLSAVSIPDSVTSIGDNAFRDCRGMIAQVSADAPARQLLETRGIRCELRESAPDEAPWEPATVYNCEEWITLRGSPSTDAESLAKIPLGARVEIVPSLDDFCPCRYDGKTGYALNQYIHTDWTPGPAALESGDYRYIVNEDGTAEIVRYLPNDEDALKEPLEEVAIPAELDGHAVVSIGKGAFSLSTNTHRFRVPEGVKRIERNAFHTCWNLNEVVLPESLTSIGDCAFGSCMELKHLRIPAGVTEIGANPFVDCRMLTELEVSPDNPALALEDGVLFSLADRRLVGFTELAEADTYAVPEGTVSIGDLAFYYCSRLKHIQLPESLTAIGVEAFMWCYDLADLELPDGLTDLGEGAFRQCYSISTLTLPDGIAHIPDMAFWDCDPLKELKLPDGVLSIGELAFGSCDSLEALTVPSGVAYIGLNAFDSPDLLVTVTPGSYANRYCLENAVRHNVVTGDGVPGEIWQPARVARCDAWISLREAPSTDAGKLAEIPLDAVVLVVNSDESFLRCQYDGKEGYVLAEYIDLD